MQLFHRTYFCTQTINAKNTGPVNICPHQKTYQCGEWQGGQRKACLPLNTIALTREEHLKQIWSGEWEMSLDYHTMCLSPATASHTSVSGDLFCDSRQSSSRYTDIRWHLLVTSVIHYCLVPPGRTQTLSLRQLWRYHLCDHWSRKLF